MQRAGKAKRRLLFLLVMIVVAVVALPTIIAKSPLRNALLGMAMPAGGWQIECRQSTLAWAGQQTLSGVTIVDPEGSPLLTAESITVEKSLLALAADQSKLGTIKVVQPTLHAVTRAEGSNIEDFLAALQPPAEAEQQETVESSPRNAPDVILELIDGVVRGTDLPTQQLWALSEAYVVIDLGGTPGGKPVISGSIRFPIPEGGSGTARQGDGQLKFRFSQVATNQHELEILAADMPLEPFEPWLARVWEGCRISGTVSTEAKLRFTNYPQRELELFSVGSLQANQFRMTAASLHGDIVSSTRLEIPWNVSTSGDLIMIEQLELEADWAQLRARGEVRLEELSTLAATQLPKREASMAGSVDLAKLAAMLPRTLRLRQAVRVDSGKLEFNARAMLGDEGYHWTAQATAQDLRGVEGSRPIVWEQPLQASVELSETPQGPQLEQLLVNAPFVQANFGTKPNQIVGQFEFDLGMLWQQLGQFVEQSDWEVDGKGTGNLSIRQAAGDHFEAGAELDLTGITISENRRILWDDPYLQISVQAKGRQDNFVAQQIDTLTVQLHGAHDDIQAVLLKPIDLSRSDDPFHLQLTGKGSLDSWAGRLRPWVSTIPTELSGAVQLNAKLELSPAAVRVSESRTKIAGLRVRNGSQLIDEPHLEIQGDCRWDAETNAIASHEIQLVSSSIGFRSRDLAFASTPHGAPTASGSVAFRTNLERLALMAGLIGDQTSTWPRGMTVGQVQLTADPQQLRADFSVTADQLQVVRRKAAAGGTVGPSEVLWNEPQLQATGQAVYSIAEDRAQLSNLNVTGQTVKVALSASLDKLRSAGRLQASGTAKYEAAALSRLLSGYLGPGIHIDGDQQIDFQIAGNLSSGEVGGRTTHWSRQWHTVASTGWKSANVFGMPVQSARLRGSLENGQLAINPVSIATGQGNLQLSPRVVFDPAPQQLFFPKGPLATNIRISPQISETMLKYVAPLVAGATRAEGHFSVELESAQVPLDNPKHARMAGRLDVHQLSVAPGPMINELVTIVRQVEALSKKKEFLQSAATARSNQALTMRNQQIDFQVVDGRVYHRNLVFMVDDVPVSSHGSVGFDQTLALLVEIPIQDKWVQREPALRSLAGQSLQIPIGGSFQRPQVDQRAIADISQRVLQSAASETIGNEINRQLDKLLRPR